ncbi:MAG: hypothetical protein IKN54_03540 [Lachnospiraceae bacterium]|nr:hypothetical protein [Lachnospiraceae bacterium]
MLEVISINKEHMLKTLFGANMDLSSELKVENMTILVHITYKVFPTDIKISENVAVACFRTDDAWHKNAGLIL